MMRTFLAAPFRLTRVSRKLKADLLLTFCAVVWGATFVVVKDALGDSSVLMFLLLRFIAATALLAVIYRRELRREPDRHDGTVYARGAIRAGALIGCLLFAGFTFQTMGIGLTSPSKAGFITGFSAVLVPVLLALFGSARIRAGVWTGAVLAVAGLYFLAIPSGVAGMWRAGGAAGLNRGDLLVLCSAFIYALHIISIGRYTPHYSAGALSLVQVATTAVLAAIAVPVFSAMHWEAASVHWTPRFIAAVAVTGVLATGLAFSAQVWAQQNTSSSHAAILFTLEPVVAMLTSFVFRHERLGARALFGGALILAGILLAELGGSSGRVRVRCPTSSREGRPSVTAAAQPTHEDGVFRNF